MKITQKLKIMLKSILSIQMGEVATDKAVLIFDGEELIAGMEVFVMGEENEPVPAADGDYTTEDGKVIKVVEGKVAEIVDPEAEVAEEPVQEETQESVEEIQEETNEEVAPADEPEEAAEEISIEDRVAQLESRFAAFVEGIDAVMNAIAEMENRIADLEAKMVSVEAPAAEPIDEQPKVEETHQSRLSYLRKK